MKLFLSYAHKDKHWRDSVLEVLAPARKYHDLSIFEDSQIVPGSDWFKRITTELNTADGCILLVTPAYLASDFVSEYELPLFLKKQEQGRLFFWISLEPALYQSTPLARIQSVGDPDKPVSFLPRKAQAAELVRIAKEILHRIAQPQTCRWCTDRAAFPLLPGPSWWNDAVTGGAQSIAISMKEHVRPDALPAAGHMIPKLTDGVIMRLADRTPSLECGQSIIDDANYIISEYSRELADGGLLVKPFRAVAIDEAWAKVINDADDRGPVTLISLFLSIFGRGGRFSTLADANLSRLLT